MLGKTSSFVSSESFELLSRNIWKSYPLNPSEEEDVDEDEFEFDEDVLLLPPPIRFVVEEELNFCCL